MSVEALLQALLIHIVADEADTAAQYEERVDGADVDVFLCFLTKRVEQKKTC